MTTTTNSAQAEAINLNLRMGLGELVTELQRRLESRVDVVADSRHMAVEVRDGRFYLLAKRGTPLTEWMDADGMVVQPHAIGQVLERCDVPVPVKFGTRLAAEHPDLAANLVTDLLHASGTTRLVRMMDGQVRAFLSNRYRCLDNYDLAAHALRVARDNGGEVIEAHLTPTAMRIKMVRRDLWESLETFQRAQKAGEAGNHAWFRRVGWHGADGGDLPGGSDSVSPLIQISNSETGNGGCTVGLGVFSGACCNGCIISREMRAVHLGGELDAGLMQEDTRQADAQAIYLKARDVMSVAFKEEGFRRLLAPLQKAASTPIANPRPALDAVVAAGLLTEQQRDDVFAHFIRDYKPTVWGLASAISRFAQDTDDAQLAADLEAAAGEVANHPEMVLAAV